MSHFCLLMITQVEPTEAVLQRELSPFIETDEGGKWDWYQIGGRWTGMLKPSYDPEKDPRNQEVCPICGGTGFRMDDLGRETRGRQPDYTCNGCDGKKTRTKWPTDWVNVGNILQVKDLNLLALQDEAINHAVKLWRMRRAALSNIKLPAWPGDDAPDEAYKAFWEHPEVKKAHNKRELMWMSGAELVEMATTTEEQVAQQALNNAVVPFAVLKDGKWTERGEMGWFGMVLNGQNKDDWATQVNTLLRSLSPTDWLTVIDCHI